jgi:thioesterase domain-containing protein
MAGQEIAFLAMLDTHCPLPQSPGQRLLSHFSHLKQLGVREYLRAVSHGVKNRLISTSESDAIDRPLTAEEQALEQRVVADEDPLARIEWTIYRATQINYVTPKRMPFKITYFFARDNEYKNRFEDNRLRWKTIAGGGFEVYVIPGRHNTIREEPHVGYLAEKLMGCLDRAH